jgi:plastocyanin
MGVKNKDGFFRIIGIVGLLLLLLVFAWGRNRKPIKKNTVTANKSDAHDHANPASHGEVKGKKLAHSDTELKPSGKFIAGQRLVTYEAFKFAFAPDPLIVRSNETVILTLKSRDVAHGMLIPEIDFSASFPKKGEEATASFKAPSKPGKYPIFCSIYCGSDHGKMQGVLLVLPAEQ